ncbi:MAG: Uma2 family endonuclease [Acidobacteriota bacterium]|nr:Uma2 family endonuclease [Acidobacteriota bacterium]
MATLTQPIINSPNVVIPIPAGIDADDLIIAISGANEGIRIEQTSPDRLTIMPPAGFESSEFNSEIIMQLRIWAKQDERGRSVDSNTLFSLPNGKKLGPDAAWISKERLLGLTAEEKKKFIHRVPEFVIELLSSTDSKPELRRKMHAWIDQGVLLGWLIDPNEKSVAIYRPRRSVEVIDDAMSVVADGPVSGFVLQLADIWKGFE